MSPSSPPSPPSPTAAGAGITLTVNGQPTTMRAPATVANLVSQLDLVGKRIAVERNGEIVPRSRHADAPLTQGDRVEIVVAVGGG